MSQGKTAAQYQIIFLRHGESVGNAESRHQGQADFPLTEKGKGQAKDLAHLWKDSGQQFDLILSSPLTRALDTAKIIAHILDIPLETDPLWMERDNGKLAGLLHEEAEEKIPRPDFIPLYQPIAETGESQWELYLRAGKAINSLMKREPGRYLVVGHGGLFDMVMHSVIGVSPQPDFQSAWFRFSNTGFTPVVYHLREGRWEIQGHNLSPHLPDHEQ